MEELREGWRKVKLSEVIKFNPKESIKKNEIAKYIEMANLQCFSRNVLGYEEKPFKGGTKFRNGDTLLARITPCLENGKTAYVDCLDEGEVGFGSTEYIILREEEGETNKKFIYYLAISQSFRDLAIKSMTGTSGRQRVQTDVLINSEITLPPLETQEKIAKILSDLDDKIELNNEMNKTLEEMAQTLFKRWFIDFEFPNENGEPYKSSGGKMIESELGEIPEGWEVGNFRRFIKETLGGDWGKETSQGNYQEEVYCIRGADIIESTKGNFEKIPKRFILNKNFQNKKLISGDMIVEISGGSPTQSTGRIGYINRIILEKFTQKLITTNFCRIIRPFNSEDRSFIYTYWKKLYVEDIFFQYENGTTGIKNFDINNFLDKHEIVIPKKEIRKKYNRIIDSYTNMIQENGKEKERLIKLRDTLLPKLMNGEIEI